MVKLHFTSVSPDTILLGFVVELNGLPKYDIMKSPFLEYFYFGS